MKEGVGDVVKPEGCWVPGLIIVCAGWYGALDSDELASVSLNANDFENMARILLERIQEASNSTRLLFGLERGYQLGRVAGGGNLQLAVVKTVRELIFSDF